MTPQTPGLPDSQGHDGHDHHAHGPTPLEGVDVTTLHAVVEELAATLHEYVSTAAGVRAEFGSPEADEDPRILALEARVSGHNAELYDLIHDRLGMHADLTGMVWDGEDDDSADDADEDSADEFHLGFVVAPPATLTDQSMDAVLGIVDNGGADIARRLLEQGFIVAGWSAARGGPVTFDEDEDEDDEDET